MRVIGFVLLLVLFTQDKLSRADRKKLEKWDKARVKREEKERTGVPWNRAHQVKSKHFVVRCNSTRDETQRYATFLEALYEEYSKIFAMYTPEDHTGHIWIFKNQDEYVRLMKKPYSIGGYYDWADNTLRVFRGFSASGLTCEQTLAHEAFHDFQDRIIRGEVKSKRSMPTWVLEGMATMFESAELDSKGKIVIRGVAMPRLWLLQRSIRDGTSMSLRKMMSAQKSFGPYHYAHAGPLHTYLLYGPKKETYRKAYFQFLEEAVDSAQRGRLLPNRRFEELIREHAGLEFDAFEKEWREWLPSVKPPRMGTVEGQTFSSAYHRFRFTVPDPTWRIVPDREVGAIEACYVKYGEEDLRLGVAVFDLDGKQTARQFHDAEQERMNRNRAYKKWKLASFRLYEEESLRSLKVNGYDALERIIKAERNAGRKGVRRYHRVFIEAYGTMYRFSLDTPYDKGSRDFRKEFMKIVNSFQPLATRLD